MSRTPKGGQYYRLLKPKWCNRALEKSANSFSKIACRILTHIIYIFGRIMEVTFAKEYSAILKDLLHYLG